MPAEDPDWASLSPDLWRLCLLAARPTDRAPGHDREQAADSWVRWCRLVVCAAATCRALHDALLGPQSSELWTQLHVRSVHRIAARRPCTGLEPVLRTLRLALPAAGPDQEEAWQGFNRLVTSQMRHVQHVAVWGGGWDLFDLQLVLARVRKVSNLTVRAVTDSDEAACISAALSRCTVTSLKFRGTQPVAFPCSVQRLDLSVCGEPKLCRAALQRLQPLSQLRVLYLGLACLPITRAEVQSLAACHPQLEELILHLVLFDFIAPHSIASLPELLPSVHVGITMLVIETTPESVISLLQQMRGLTLIDLELHCPPAVLTAAVEEQLTRCRVTQQLALCVEGQPAKRLQCVPDSSV